MPYKIDDNYYDESNKVIGTESDIRAGTFKPGMVTSLPTKVTTLRGG